MGNGENDLKTRVAAKGGRRICGERGQKRNKAKQREKEEEKAPPNPVPAKIKTCTKRTNRGERDPSLMAEVEAEAEAVSPLPHLSRYRHSQPTTPERRERGYLISSSLRHHRGEPLHLFQSVPHSSFPHIPHHIPPALFMKKRLSPDSCFSFTSRKGRKEGRLRFRNLRATADKKMKKEERVGMGFNDLF